MTADFKKYNDAASFRRVLEDRLKNIAYEQSIPLDRLRRGSHLTGFSRDYLNQAAQINNGC